MAMDVTLRQLRAYVAVLESASFSEAAKTMHLSQAALSGLIKELESRVGVRLLDRTTRKVSASAVGETFAPMARRVLSNLDEALDNLTNLKELRRGLVRVAAPETLSCTLLPELIAGYNNSHPGVDVRFDDVPIQEVLDTVRSRPPRLHLVLTGRGAPPELIALADLVSEVRPIKHPYEQGIPAQRGIEF